MFSHPAIRREDYVAKTQTAAQGGTDQTNRALRHKIDEVLIVSLCQGSACQVSLRLAIWLARLGGERHRAVAYKLHGRRAEAVLCRGLVRAVNVARLSPLRFDHINMFGR